MAKILVTYWRSDEISANATLNFWDAFFQELCNAGNDVLAINNSFYNIWISNKTDNPAIEAYLHDQVDLFKPELIIAFNNRILQSIVEKYKDVPIVLYDGDELRFFSDLDTIRKNINNYKIFSLSKEFEKDYREFGFKASQIYYMPAGTAIQCNSTSKPTMNISFLGQRRWYLSKRIQNAIADGRDIQTFYAAYLEHLKTGSFDYEQLFLKNGGVLSESSYNDSDLWPLFDDSYLVFANLVDLGLHLGGHEGHWRDIVDFIPQLAVTHSCARIFTLKENQNFYNSSILSLSPIHPQARGKAFSWRSFDIMASNACLVSSYSSELDELTSQIVKVPMYHSPAEAREICIKLLNNTQMRQEIVAASHEYVDKHCRWRDRFLEMQEILGLTLVKVGVQGKFIKLSPVLPEEYTTHGKHISIPSNKDNLSLYHCQIISIDEEIKKVSKTKLALLTIITALRKLLCFYEKYAKIVKQSLFGKHLCFCLIALTSLYAITVHLFPQHLISVPLNSTLLFT